MVEDSPSTIRPGQVALSFSVMDAGPGIASADQETIFRPFAPGDDNLAAGRPSGSGLGLAICHQLASLMGGEILLDSALGQGSRFTLRLPAVPLAFVANGLEGKPAHSACPPATGHGTAWQPSASDNPGSLLAHRLGSPSPAPAPGPFAGPSPDPGSCLATVLVVDDEPDNLHLTAEILRHQGLDLVSAADGPSGLRLATALRPDLILLDVRMLGMDGFQVCERLKADPTTRSIPVLFLTALDQFADKARGFAVGAVDYITKPCDPRELLLRVTNHLRPAQSSSAPPTTGPKASPTAEPGLGAPERAADWSVQILLCARDRLLAYLANPPDLITLARHCGTNRNRLQQLFKTTLGMSVFGYVREQRLQRARALLAAGGQRIDQIATSLGYGHSHNFSRAFKQRFGLAPSQWPDVANQHQADSTP